MRGAVSCVTRRRKAARWTVCRLSKLTTQSVGTLSRHPPQLQFRHQSTLSASECRYHHRSDPVGYRVTRQHQHGSVATRCGREPDLTAFHASLAAASHQSDHSSAGPQFSIAVFVILKSSPRTGHPRW